MRYLTIILLCLAASCKAQNPCQVNYNGTIITCAQMHVIDSVATVVANDSAVATANRRSAFIQTLKSQAYRIAQGLAIGATPSASQLTAKFWVDAYNNGWINPYTGKIDSTQGYIK